MGVCVYVCVCVCVCAHARVCVYMHARDINQCETVIQCHVKRMNADITI